MNDIFIDSLSLSFKPYQFTKKDQCIRYYTLYVLNRLQGMFKWNNLPDTIPQRNLELFLQTKGHIGITDVNGDLYAFTGGFGGIPDPYYMPTEYIVNNPALQFNKVLTIHKDVEIIRNDSLMVGLYPLINRYVTQLVENDVTQTLADINIRLTSIISAGDSRTKAAAEKYIKDLIDGKVGIIGDNSFTESLKTQPYSSSGYGNVVTQLIEYQQYLKASLFNELGIQMNWNAKREVITSSETGMNEDALLPLIDDMIANRQLACEQINKMFGTSISVEFNGVWEDIHEDVTEESEDVMEDSDDGEDGDDDGNDDKSRI